LRVILCILCVLGIFGGTASLSNRIITCIACEFVNPTLFMFMYVTVRFRFGAVVFSVGDLKDILTFVCLTRLVI
jgi:hypothetical protein